MPNIKQLQLQEKAKTELVFNFVVFFFEAPQLIFHDRTLMVLIDRANLGIVNQ